MASAGRILIMPKGNYDSSATYKILDLVNHNGTSWLAKKTATGIEPSDANNEYWYKMVDFNIVNNLETTEEGSVLDARQGKVIADALDVLEKNVFDALGAAEENIAAALDGYKIYTANYSGTTDANGFFVDSNLSNDIDILSCKLISKSGFCTPYYKKDANWSFLIEDWKKNALANESVNIKVIYATKST